MYALLLLDDSNLVLYSLLLSSISWEWQNNYYLCSVNINKFICQKLYESHIELLLGVGSWLFEKIVYIVNFPLEFTPKLLPTGSKTTDQSKIILNDNFA